MVSVTVLLFATTYSSRYSCLLHVSNYVIWVTGTDYAESLRPSIGATFLPSMKKLVIAFVMMGITVVAGGYFNVFYMLCPSFLELVLIQRIA